MRTRSKPKPLPAPRPQSEGAVLTKATIRAAEKLRISQKVLARIVGLSEAVVSRMNSGAYSLERATGKPFELAVLFVRSYRSLDAIVGGDDNSASAWVATANTALGGKPIDLMQTVRGLIDVINYLDARRAQI